MGIMSALTGNASEVKPEKVAQDIDPLLAPGEEITKAYKMMRDYFVFTSSRIIMVDVQGATGKKKNFTSMPYRSITSFSIETSGFGFDDSELVIHIHGMEDIRKEFKKSINIADVQLALATQILKN